MREYGPEQTINVVEGKIMTSKTIAPSSSLPAGAALAVLLTMFAAVIAQPVAAQTAHVDKDSGYRIMTPRGFEKSTGFVFDWDSFGGSSETITASDHRLASFTKKRPRKGFGDWFGDYGMTLYYFPEDLQAELGDLGDKRYAGAKIYRSFEDYAKDKITGFYFEKEKSTKVAGFPGKMYEMKFEKLTSTPQKWLAITWKITGGEFAVVYSCDEEAYRKMRGEFIGAANSFRLLRKDGLNWMGLKDPDREKPQGPTESQERAMTKMTAEELVRWKEDRRKEIYKKEIDGLEKGWRKMNVGNYLIVSEEDAKFTSDVAKQVKAMQAWCESTFDDVAFEYEDHPPYQTDGGIIKIKKRDNNNIIIGGFSGGFSGVPRTTITRNNWGNDSEMERVRDFVLDSWLNSRHRTFSWDLPGWLSYGLNFLVDAGKLRGSKMIFPFDKESLQWNMRWSGDGQVNQDWIPLQTLFGMSLQDIYKNKQARAQSICAVHYLLVGPGRKSSKTRDVMAKYLSSLSSVLNKRQQERRAENVEKAKDALEGRKSDSELSEEELLAKEDEEYAKRRQESGGAEDKKIASEIIDMAFGYWTDADWKALDRSAAMYTSKMLQ